MPGRSSEQIPQAPSSQRFILRRARLGYVGLAIDLANLLLVAGPFAVAVLAAALLALRLQRSAGLSPRPSVRERCVGCRYEGDLVDSDVCYQRCSVNELPSLALVVFVVSATFVALALAYPNVLIEFVVPAAFVGASDQHLLLGTLLVAFSGGALAVAAYCVQDRARERRILLQVSIVAALMGLGVGAAIGGTVGAMAVEMTPLALAAVLIGIAVEHRARMGRPAIGIRGLGAATLPMFWLGGLALVRIYEMVRIA
jgi:hypothetical protein